MGCIAGIDIGGTNIKCIVMSEEDEVLARESVSTPYRRPVLEVVDLIEEVVRRMLREAGREKSKLSGIGLGIPGPTNFRTGVAYEVPFLGWSNVNICEMLEERFHVPVFCDNDANLNALGEMHFGAGRGRRDMILLTLGTGLGCGIIVDGRILRGANNVAAEAGHMVIENGGAQCVCGKRGCFESLCSATALVRYAKELVKQYPDSILLRYAGGEPEKIDGKMIYSGCLKEDPASLRVRDIFVEKLTTGLVNLIDLFNPECIILSGGVSGMGEVLLSPLRVSVEKLLMHKVQKCDIIIGKLYTMAGVMGACYMVRENRTKREL